MVASKTTTTKRTRKTATTTRTPKLAKPEDAVLSSIMEEAMRDYSREVILSRAIPDARDGLKPVQRHIMWVMNQNKLTPTSRHLKTNTVVGNVMPYHAHGDSSIKEAIDNLSKEWVFNIPLIDMYGNNGGIDGSPAAAGRYTEIRQSIGAELMLERVDTGAARMVDNYDGTRKEPELLPSRVPLVLINGALGIAEGVSTAIIPHNPVELMDACLHLAKSPNARISTLTDIILGPDFPTGGKLVNPEAAVKEEIETGRSRYTVRGDARIVMKKGENPIIEITALPWDPWRLGRAIVTIPSLIESIDDVLEPMKGIGILSIDDESDETNDQISIVITFRKTCNKETLESVLEHLYAKSLLQVDLRCSNMVISNGRPEVLGVAEILRRFNDFRLDCLRGTWAYDKAQDEDKLELVNADITAFSDPDGLMKITRSAKDKADMVKKLMRKYKLTERQAVHIADMPLHRFNDAARLVVKRKSEKDALEADIARLIPLLTDDKAAHQALLADLRETRKRLVAAGYERKTKIIKVDTAAVAKKVVKKTANLIPDKKVVALASERALFKLGAAAFANQSAAGRGKDVLNQECSTRDWIYAICSNGQSVGVRADTLPNVNLDAEAEPTSKSQRKLNPQACFKGIAALNPDVAANGHFVMVTKRGFIKALDGKVALKDAMRAKNGYIVSAAHGMRGDDDEIVLARWFSDEEMKKWRVVAEVSWDGKTKRIKATRDIPLANYIECKHGLAGSGRRDIKDNGGSVDSIKFVEVNK